MFDWGPLTHRQFRVWEEYIGLSMDRPTRTENYLMQIAYVVAQSNSKTPLKFEQFKLKFVNPGATDKVSADERKRRTEFAKAQRIGMWGGPDAMTEVDEHGNVIKEAKIKPKSVNVLPAPTTPPVSPTAPNAPNVPLLTPRGAHGRNPRTGTPQYRLPG